MTAQIQNVINFKRVKQIFKIFLNEEKFKFFKFHTDSIPSAKLKEIGRYCLKMNGKDKNCNETLAMLKTRFKKCNTASKYDIECNKFKLNFCTAFSKFPCCVDVS